MASEAAPQTSRPPTTAVRRLGPDPAALWACAAEDFLCISDRRVTEPALLSDDQLALSLSRSLPSYRLALSLSLFLPSVALISSLLHLRLGAAHCPPQRPLPLSTAEKAKRRGPDPPPRLSRSFDGNPPVFSVVSS